MRLLRIAENLLHIGGCVVLMFGVTVTVFVMAAFTDTRPLGMHAIEFGLIFTGIFAAVGTTLLLASTAIRKRFLS